MALEPTRRPAVTEVPRTSGRIWGSLAVGGRVHGVGRHGLDGRAPGSSGDCPTPLAAGRDPAPLAAPTGANTARAPGEQRFRAPIRTTPSAPSRRLRAGIPRRRRRTIRIGLLPPTNLPRTGTSRARRSGRAGVARSARPRAASLGRATLCYPSRVLLGSGLARLCGPVVRGPGCGRPPCPHGCMGRGAYCPAPGVRPRAAWLRVGARLCGPVVRGPLLRATPARTAVGCMALFCAALGHPVRRGPCPMRVGGHDRAVRSGSAGGSADSPPRRGDPRPRPSLDSDRRGGCGLPIAGPTPGRACCPGPPHAAIGQPHSAPLATGCGSPP